MNTDKTIVLSEPPYIGYRFLDYEVYRVTATHIWVVNWVNSQTTKYQYKLQDKEDNHA